MEILNRKARFSYFVEEEIECGIELFGTEVKSIREGSCNIKDSYAYIRNNEVFVINMYNLCIFTKPPKNKNKPNKK